MKRLLFAMLLLTGSCRQNNQLPVANSTEMADFNRLKNNLLQYLERQQSEYKMLIYPSYFYEANAGYEPDTVIATGYELIQRRHIRCRSYRKR